MKFFRSALVLGLLFCSFSPVSAQPCIKYSIDENQKHPEYSVDDGATWTQGTLFPMWTDVVRLSVDHSFDVWTPTGPVSTFQSDVIFYIPAGDPKPPIDAEDEFHSFATIKRTWYLGSRWGRGPDSIKDVTWKREILADGRWRMHCQGVHGDYALYEGPPIWGFEYKYEIEIDFETEWTQGTVSSMFEWGSGQGAD